MPPAVTVAAIDLLTQLTSEGTQVIKVAQKCEEGRGILLSDEASYFEANHKRSVLKQQFVDAAASSMNEGFDPPTVANKMATKVDSNIRIRWTRKDQSSSDVPAE